MSCLSCSVPPLGCTDFQRFSYTTPLTSHSSSSPSLRWNGKVRRRISRSSSYSSNLWGSQLPSFNGSYEPCFSIVRIWISPLCMGRRSSKIATRKGAQDLKKGKLYSKIGKEVVSAVKKGGPNPLSNTALAVLIEKAKELDVPKDIVERNIKKASEKGQEAFIEKVYEVYGFGGVGFVVEVSTDNVNRSVSAIKRMVKDCGGKMADSGSVIFRFKRARIVNVKVSDAEKDQLLEIALDAGAEDVIDPPDNEDASEDQSDRYYKIVSSPEGYSVILSKLRDEGISFEPDNGYELLPVNPVEVDDEAMELNKELFSELLELDDVDAVYTDQI
ncbi:probable transcriptional regulatory protein At2g25830 [Amaranthus tricolor]|uniref:probable transcriptional regulatory protein At2g25830 n=1 Tax=Amaranthus tricolor TaxID=29722 RepID=UPI002589553B|nr:probable transcriptional regulatory protein At2g25830 [Amaranthus tricolor]